jgi:starch-binding outer membrane protein, SusD/RagB family
MKIISSLPAILLSVTFFLGSSCKKDFLDAKPSTSIVQPSTIAEFKTLLDNAEVINQSTPSLQQLATDEYFVADFTLFQSISSATARNSCTWGKNLYDGEIRIGSWNRPFQVIFYANSTLNGLLKMKVQHTPEWNDLKGWALFIRAFSYYNIVRNFSKSYEESTATSDLGIPLRTKPEIDEVLPRASVQQTYDFILSDLVQAKSLLTNNFSFTNRNRPSKTAAMALMARIYLSMRKYDKAEAYADSSLSIYNRLIDYNTISTTAAVPFSFSNDESIYYATQIIENAELTLTYGFNYYGIDTSLIQLYNKTNDLRFLLYFNRNTFGNYEMKSSYSGRAYPFTGLATDEIYIIKAECAARRNDVVSAMAWLNNLLIKRYRTGTFTPVAAADATDALNIVLSERRKALVWRGLRWTDLKRLNMENANIILIRKINNQTYTLLPNDKRYVFPIPDDEIALSGIQQNER